MLLSITPSVSKLVTDWVSELMTNKFIEELLSLKDWKQRWKIMNKQVRMRSIMFVFQTGNPTYLAYHLQDRAYVFFVWGWGGGGLI